MIEIPDFLEEILDANISITIVKDSYDRIIFDLHLEAKSHLYVTKEDDKWYAHMRYDEKYLIEDIGDLRSCARRGMHGRDYINPFWGRYLNLM
jgi:hypothetical protein